MVVNERFKASIRVTPRTAAFYAHVLDGLHEAGVPFLLGGAFAFEVYTDIGGRTKDLDLFLLPRDVDRALAAMEAIGYETVIKAPHWLAKILLGRDFVDVIFGSGNGLTQVDDTWFEHSRPAEVLGREERLVPIEEMLWSKAFIMERERYDGADVVHLIRTSGRTMDWRRLIDRFGASWRVLVAHILLFDFAFPSERGRVPSWVREELLGRALAAAGDVPDPDDRVCLGTLLSREQYLPDVEALGYRDGRLAPYGTLDEDALAELAREARQHS